MGRITINDIARELGVSGSTVSRALNDNPKISTDVIQKVKNTAARLGYVPNISASSLRSGKSRMIGLIVRDIRDGFCLEVIPSVEAACAERNYGLLLCNAGADAQRERQYIQTLLQRRVDGIILITPTTSMPDPYLHLRRDVPLVFIDIEITGNPLCAVTVDHNMGGYLATRHLLELGHRDIAYLTGPLSLSSSIRCVEGYKQAMSEAGIPFESQLILLTKKTGIDDGFDGMLDLLKIVPRPTAVATFSDLLAAGVLQAARQYGLVVPDDLSIIGYDDIPLISLLNPPLTTIKQNKDELGKIAVELLFSEMHEAGHAHQQVRISPTLVVRGSTAPPAPDRT